MTITKRNFERTGSIQSNVANSLTVNVLVYPLPTTVGRTLLYNAKCVGVGQAAIASGAVAEFWGLIEGNVPPNVPTSGSSGQVTAMSSSYTGAAAPTWAQQLSGNDLRIRFTSPGTGGELFDLWVELDIWHLERA